MSSTIKLSIMSEHGELLARQTMTVEYGNEAQDVIIILDDPSISRLPGLTAREALDDCMAQQLALIEGDDA